MECRQLRLKESFKKSKKSYLENEEPILLQVNAILQQSISNGGFVHFLPIQHEERSTAVIRLATDAVPTVWHFLLLIIIVL